jgi:hypothetical protein
MTNNEKNNIHGKADLRKDHIAVFDDFFTDDNCAEFLHHFEVMKQRGHSLTRNQYDTSNPLEKKDTTVGFGNLGAERALSLEETKFNLHVHGFTRFMNDVILKIYTETYCPSLLDNLMVFEGKVQKTLTGEGYHVWHAENVGAMHRNRVLAWSLFLNDVAEGGETEFLHQNVRFEPKKGRMLVFPAYFTHIHRGNPPLTGEKFIATGWAEYKN